ncbi:hypothetical protein [Anaeromassilibacillus senegalensis]|uniref:DUF4315 family protein n=1 Tax=Anaeromassilibacillus senegalensis TaxID=1673717 RepID=A0ABS9CLN3_9FIRM|nr:hypothetical protein [Anaeromassilibacillus senegalensis]MCF2651700.1 hypothetical protein [Anaeromassilibacillus senegalensis]
MQMNIKTSENTITMDDIQRRIIERKAAEEKAAADAERARIEKLEALQSMSTAEYLAYRTGKPALLSNEELAALSMEEYIKVRQK